MDVNTITKEKWLQDCFPEWGRWLLEDIEETIVEKGSFACWWLGCTGIWIKSEGGANICIDLYSANNKVSHHKVLKNDRGPDFQMGRMNGSCQIGLNPRNIPHVMDPFEIREIDAFICTHDHSDHMDPYSTGAVLQNHRDIPFIGPKYSHDKWVSWGVPEARIITVRPGDTVQIKDTCIHVTDAFDRTALITAPPFGSIEGRLAGDMDERAVNYVIETPGGTFYHSGDSHFSNYYLKHGKQFKIDVAIAAYGDNPKGITDKMTSSDVLRMAENLNCKVIIPVHYDVWPSFYSDPKEIQALYAYRKERLQYQFHPFIWQVGGKFVYPQDRDKYEYMYPQGFTDAFENEPNLPYKAFL